MNEYKTKDFYLASLLNTVGFRLCNSYKMPEGVYFVFEILDENKLQNTISEFLNFTATINMRRFTSSMIKLRKEISKHK